MSYENQICEAIQILVDKAVKSAEYNRTVQATIVASVDESLGKYKVQYQDSFFFAYTVDSSTVYQKGAKVYVLIPNNDMSRNKSIIGLVEKLGSGFISAIEEEDKLQKIGANGVSRNNTFGLISYKPTLQLIYDSRATTGNFISFDKSNLAEYMLHADSLIVGATFRTELPEEQQLKGNYGIVFEIAFRSQADGSEVIRNYVLDVNRMKGTPYSFIEDSRQIVIFDVDGENFIEIRKVYVFNKDFPNQDNNALKQDIFINNLEIYASKRLSEDELKSFSLNIFSPRGITFLPSDPQTEKKVFEAELKSRGRVVDTETQEVEFYWFEEDARVDMQHHSYSSLGGRGWACLNEFTQLSPNVRQWKPTSHRFEVTQQQVKTGSKRFKCVVKYGEIIAEKEFVVKRQNAEYYITLTSSNGEEFFFDNGSTTVTCIIANELGEDISSRAGADIQWSVTDNGNVVLLTDDGSNSLYKSKESEIERLKNLVKNGQRTQAEIQEELNNLEHELRILAKRPRIEENKLHLNVSSYTNYVVVKAAVTLSGNDYLGTGQIVLSNNKDSQKAELRLVIKNGDAVYQYDTEGVSPILKDKKKGIRPLEIAIFDVYGRQVPTNFGLSDIQWIVPVQNTLLALGEVSPDNIDRSNEEQGGYVVVKREHHLPYSIAKAFNTRENNQIRLSVMFRGKRLEASTRFSFTKEGDSGTNGTGLFAQIVCNSTTGENPDPVYTIGQGLNYTPKGHPNNWFSLRLWKDGEIIWDSPEFKENVSVLGKPLTIEWSIPVNKYSEDKQDTPLFSIIKNHLDIAEFSILRENFSASSPRSAMVQCRVVYDEYELWATQPVKVVSSLLNDRYRVRIPEDAGFDRVLYSSDGTAPQYHKRPFALIVEENIGGQWTDISLLNKVEYTWKTESGIYDISTQTYTEPKTLNIIEDVLLSKNRKRVEVASKNNGASLVNQVICSISIDGGAIPKITVLLPIHVSLNRYGNSAMNNWNGNSIQINNKGGLILAPQIGAGRKEFDNTYTGLFMGEMKEAGQDTSQTGLAGYHHGERSFYIDANYGFAQFGKAGTGQIVLDPISNKGLVYSSNFWKEYEESGPRRGMPKTDYVWNEDKGQYRGQSDEGMLIDLTTGRIIYGSGAFSVDDRGYLTAKNGGKIAGWSITRKALSNGQTGMNAEDDLARDGVMRDRYITHDPNGGDGISQVKATAFWAGSGAFAVAHDGYLKATKAAIGDGRKAIFIGRSTSDDDSSAVFSGAKSALVKNEPGFYLGTDGLSLGRTHTVRIGGETVEVSNFQVDVNGNLYAKQGYIGKRGEGWFIRDRAISMGVRSSFFGDDDGIYFGQDGLAMGSGFKVTSRGALSAHSGNIGGWNIDDRKLSIRKPMTPAERQRYNISNPNAEKGIELWSDGSIRGVPGQWNRPGGQSSWYIDASGQASLDLVSGWIDVSNVQVTDGSAGGKQNLWVWIHSKMQEARDYTIPASQINWYDIGNNKIPSYALDGGGGDVSSIGGEWVGLYYIKNVDYTQIYEGDVPGLGKTSWLKKDFLTLSARRFCVKDE